MTTLIELKDVSKVYTIGENKVEALRNVSLKINSGEFVGIIGPSGAGKSTLMNMVGCLDTPTSGDIYLLNKKITEMSESSLARIRGKTIGFIFQQFNLINYLNALENVMMPMIFQGIGRKKREERAKELLELVDLGDRIYHKPNQLSGGQQQRIAIARALANDPDIILADEPTGNLDSKTGEKVFSFLIKLNEENKKTIIVVTHDIKIAEKCKRIITIKDGLIVDKL